MRARDSLVKNFETQKTKNKPCKNETSRLIKNTSEISRSCQNFPRPTFFEVPFATPYITADENDEIDALIWDSDRNNLLDDIQSRIGLKHPIVYDTYDLCAYHKEGKLQAFNVAMLKTILRHFEVPFRAKDRKADLIRLLTKVIQECNCWKESTVPFVKQKRLQYF